MSLVFCDKASNPTACESQDKKMSKIQQLQIYLRKKQVILKRLNFLPRRNQCKSSFYHKQRVLKNAERCYFLESNQKRSEPET